MQKLSDDVARVGGCILVIVAIMLAGALILEAVDGTLLDDPFGRAVPHDCADHAGQDGC